MRSLLLLLLALPLAASAQPVFGVKAGLNVSNFYGFDEADLEGQDRSPSLGLMAGVTAQLPVSSSFAVQPEVLFSQKGFELSSQADAQEEINISYNVDYIEVPLLARFALPVGPFADAGVLIGPAVAFKVNEDFDVEIDGEELTGTDLEDFLDLNDEDVFESFDAGAVVGAEYGSGPFAVEARYTYGLLNINRNVEDDPDTPTIRNGVFSITGIFWFGR